MDTVGGFVLADGTRAKALTGVDDHSRFCVSAHLAIIATLGSMILTPAAAYAFQFLRFPFRRTLLIIIINAFVLPQQVVVIPLFTLWRQMGLLDNLAEG